ncbi:MAG: M56 family metallopeptidase [Oscillibacter sp.]|jgi:beta-lactamase regulating signal transducer with metallopeptidase domain|nr:M56 family metallopeptidase [Oscillibacter sp.]
MTALAGAFSVLLKLALTALPVMAAVAAVRWLLLRLGTPKKYVFALWLIVALRLCCPPGLFPAAPAGLVRPEAAARSVYVGPTRTVQDDGGAAPDDQILKDRGMPVNSRGEVVVSGWDGSSPPLTLPEAGAAVWLLGMAAMVFWSLRSWLRLRRSLAAATLREKGVYECGDLPTPFVLGVLRPRIYIPYRLTDEERSYVLLHERAHLRRGDPWWKLLGFGILTVYWWNIAAWACWALCSRDMEMACDEAVVSQLGPEAKRGYSLSLVSFAAERRFSAAVPLAFGETGAKSRVKNVLRWKRLRPGLAVLTAAACVLLTVICCTNAYGSGSWVESSGAAFTWHLDSKVRSAAVVEEVYSYGELTGRNILMQGPVGWGGLPRNSRFELSLTQSSKNEDGFSWRYRRHGRSAEYLSGAALPEGLAYTGCSTFITAEGRDRTQLASGGTVLLADVLRFQGETAAPAFDVDDQAALQAGLRQAPEAVVLRLLTSTDKNHTEEAWTAAESGSAGSRAPAASIVCEETTGDVPYPAMGGYVAQFAYDLPDGVQRAELRAMAWRQGELVSDKIVWSGAVGGEFPAAGRFWLSAYPRRDGNNWGRIFDFSMTPWTAEQTVPGQGYSSFTVDLTDVTPSDAAFGDREILSLGGSRLPSAYSLSAGDRVPLMTVTFGQHGGAADGAVKSAAPGALSDDAALRDAARGNDVLILLRLCLPASGEAGVPAS